MCEGARNVRFDLLRSLVRKLLIVVSLLGAMTALGAGPALAATAVPSVPKDCHEWNALLHIQNVKDCDNNG